MDSFLKENLGYTFVKRSGEGGGGCINQGEMYHTDKVGKSSVSEISTKQCIKHHFRAEDLKDFYR